MSIDPSERLFEPTRMSKIFAKSSWENRQRIIEEVIEKFGITKNSVQQSFAFTMKIWNEASNLFLDR